MTSGCVLLSPLLVFVMQGKMTREQYMALRRKIGGTARDYWKDWVSSCRNPYTWHTAHLLAAQHVRWPCRRGPG